MVETMKVENGVREERYAIPIDHLKVNSDMQKFLQDVVYVLENFNSKDFHVHPKIECNNGRMALIIRVVENRRD